jgi:short-subunit dehydrogenase
MSKKTIVLGASSGIGAEIAKQLLLGGHKVVFIARRTEEMEARVQECGVLSSSAKAHILTHDVAITSSAEPLFQEAIQKLEGLDEIYFASGVMYKVGIDEFNTEQDISMLQVNLIGAIAWLNLAAKYFSQKGSGKIIGISSIAGDRGRVGNPVYNTSKAALNTYLEALRNRLSKKGIQVLTVKPGFIDTAMTKGMKGLFWVISPSRAASIILQATDSGQEEIYVPARWWLVGFIIRIIPSFLFKKLSI